MMKLSASISKKVPIEGMQYSSYSCSAGIEVELPDGTALEEVVGQLKALNATLEVAVDEQVRSGSRCDADGPAVVGKKEGELGSNDDPAAPEPEGEAAQDRATQPQFNFIRTLAMEHAQSEASLAGFLKARYGVLNMAELSKGQASAVINLLKQREARLDEHETTG